MAADLAAEKKGEACKRGSLPPRRLARSSSATSRSSRLGVLCRPLCSWAPGLGRRSGCDQRLALRKRSAGPKEKRSRKGRMTESLYAVVDDRTHQRLLESLHAARGHQARKCRQKSGITVEDVGRKKDKM